MRKLTERISAGVLAGALGAGLIGCGSDPVGVTINGRLPGTFEPSKVVFVWEQGREFRVAAGTGAICMGTEIEVDGKVYGVPTDTEALQQAEVVMEPGHEYAVKIIKGEAKCGLFKTDSEQTIAKDNLDQLAQEDSLKTYIAATITS